MAMLFDADGLRITDDWIQCPAGTIPIAGVRKVWVTRRHVGRGSRVLTAALGAAAVLAIIGGVGFGGWLLRNWVWILAAPIIFLAAATIGLFDPVAIYLEKRHHELWVATDTVELPILKANKVEANKALRAIERAHERYRDAAYG